jgi:ABC-type multidrug transport system ATPase subunit
MSHGQRRRVQIAQTLLGEREIILLDEPTAGLDPLAAAELRQLVRGLAGERTIVLSSHNLAEVEQLCDRAAIIAQGKLVSSGTMDELRRAGALVRVLLADVPASGLDGVLALVRDLPGVRAARAAVDDPRAVDLEVADEGADTIASEGAQDPARRRGPDPRRGAGQEPSRRGSSRTHAAAEPGVGSPTRRCFRGRVMTPRPCLRATS